MNIELSVSLEEAESIIWNGVSEGDIMPNANKILDYLNKNDIRSGVISNMCWSGKSLKDRLNRLLPNNKLNLQLLPGIIYLKSQIKCYLG